MQDRLLMRAEKTAEGGMKGVFVSLSEGDVASYAVTLDAQGHELKRERLRHGGGQMRIAPPLDPNPPGRGAQRRGATRGPSGTARGSHAAGYAPMTRACTPATGTGGNISGRQYRAFLPEQGGEVAGGVADPAIGKYGPIALYAGGTGDVQFKDVSYKDMAI
jgi:hypothetical protein